MTIYPNFVAGAWVDGSSFVENINPSDIRDTVGLYANADRDTVESAIEAAGLAFPAWSRVSPEVRADILDRVGTEILIQRDGLGELLSREQGKILSEGVAEAVRAGRVFKFFAGEALRLNGERITSVRPGIEVEVLREPEGVIGIITPWNFPLAIPAWKIAPALAYGNTVVFKPAELVPGSAWALAEILSRAGLPEGVFNLVMGPGPQVGQILVESPRIRGISFTGSVPTGRRIGIACFERGKKVQLELGGKNPLIVLDDADLDSAVSVALNGAFHSTGQRCTASSRLVVQDGIHARFVERLTEQLVKLRVGHALKPDSQIGPVTSADQLERDLFYVGIGRAEGARLVYGGERLICDEPGYYLSPALFTDTENVMRINREEIFGPVASVIRVRDYEEALAIANDTEFGLSSGICTTSLKFASDFKRRSSAGMVTVNLPTAGVDYHAPFGGRKGSSHGPREQGAYAREFYSAVKTVYVQS
ncbi:MULTISPECIES: aldehyde dehydrogenase family protein [unclassified Bradyrhizobium]|uniref:aldehyde dehydrogenase family protein n=1 Tax=Bradyrhizobium sp. USDA 4541 TaxID=2817704 RepID=UPI0020A23FA4|nr:aldehyde dehydrogenase family protein [Bradyrhizobium sp. USDA 4541]MCP1848145.1 aldehyde dehydrogenase (NAD+) [Bradyrhizobium sp. USDA 4541]